MNTQSLNLPEDLGYTARHVWARKDGDMLVIGITDFAQDQLGEIRQFVVYARGRRSG